MRIDEFLKAGRAQYMRDRNTHRNMLARCYDTRHRSHKNYGGRGVTVCEEWREPGGVGFRRFLEDMGPKPKGKYVLDRIGNAMQYNPQNCRYITRQQSDWNRRYHRVIVIGEEMFCVGEWAWRQGVNPRIIYNRLCDGWDPVLAVLTPVAESKRMLTHDGVTRSIVGWARHLGVSSATLRTRLSRGWSVERALTRPIDRNRFRDGDGPPPPAPGPPASC